jgi:chromosome segregation ATPase
LVPPPFFFFFFFLNYVALQLTQRDVNGCNDRLIQLQAQLKKKKEECAVCEKQVREISEKVIGLGRHFQKSTEEYEKINGDIEALTKQIHANIAKANYLQATGENTALRIVQAQKAREEQERQLLSEKERARQLSIALGKVQFASAQLAEDYADQHARFCVRADGTNTDRRVVEGVSTLEYGV